MWKVKIQPEEKQNVQTKTHTSPRKRKRRLLPTKQPIFDKTFDENEEGKSGLFQLFTDPDSYFSKNKKSQKKCRSKEVKQKKAMELVEKIVSKEFTLNNDDSESSIEFLRDASDHHEGQECKKRLPFMDIRRFHQSYKPRCDSPCPPVNFPLTDLKNKNGKIPEEDEKVSNDSFISVVEDSDENLTFISSSPNKVLFKGKDYSKSKNGRNRTHLKTVQFINSTAAQNHSRFDRFDFFQDLSPISSVHEDSVIEDRQVCEETTPDRLQKITSPPAPEAKKKLATVPCKSKPASSTRLFDTLLPGSSLTAPDLSSINCNADTIKDIVTEPVSDVRNIAETNNKVGKNEMGSDTIVVMKQFLPVELSNTVINFKSTNRRKALTSTPTYISPSQQPPCSFGVSTISPADDSDELVPGRKSSHYCNSDEIFHSFEFEEVEIPEIEKQGQEKNTDNKQRKGFENKEQNDTNFKIPAVDKLSLEGKENKQRISIGKADRETNHTKTLMDTFLSNEKPSSDLDIKTGLPKRKCSIVKGTVKKVKSSNRTIEKSSAPDEIDCNDSSSNIPSQCNTDSSRATKSFGKSSIRKMHIDVRRNKSELFYRKKKLKKLCGIKMVSLENRRSSEKVERKQSRKAGSHQMKKKTEVKKIPGAVNDLSEDLPGNEPSTVIQNFDATQQPIPNKRLSSTFPRACRKKKTNENSNQWKQSYSYNKETSDFDNKSLRKKSTCKNSSIAGTNFNFSQKYRDNLPNNKKSHSSSILVEKKNPEEEKSAPHIDNSGPFIDTEGSFKAICNISNHIKPFTYLLSETEADSVNKTSLEHKKNSQILDESKAEDKTTSKSQAIRIQSTTDESLDHKKSTKDCDAPKSSLNAEETSNSKNQCSDKVEMKNSRNKVTCSSNKRSLIRVELKKRRKKQTSCTNKQSSIRVEVKHRTKKQTSRNKVKGVKQWRKNNIGKRNKRISKILNCSLLSLRDHFPERLIHQSEEHYVKTGKVFYRRILSAPPDPLCQVLSPPQGVCKESCGKRSLYYYEINHS